MVEEKKEKKTRKTTTKLTDIPEQEQKRLFGKMFKESGMKQDVILELYETQLIELETKGIKENIEHLAVNGILNEIRKKIKRETFVPKAKATGITGFIIGDSGIWDKAETIRKTAKSYVEKHGIQAAIENNYINGDNQILDSRKQIFGRDNPDYLTPLPEKLRLRTRTLYLIARTNGDKTFKYTTIQTNDNKLALAWNSIKLYRMAQTFGILKDSDKTSYTFNTSQAEDTESIFKAVKTTEDIDTIFMNTVTSEIRKIEDVEKIHKATKDAWDRHIFVRGIVTWISRDRPTTWGSIMMGLMANDENGAEVKISIPEHISMDYGEQSEVIVLGKTRQAKTRDEKGNLVDGDIVIDALGIYGIKGLTTPAELTRPETLEETAEIEGWCE